MEDAFRNHPAALAVDELLAECDVRFVRRSGPGGQHRNKVSTGAVLVHKPTGVKAEASERRSQAENRAVAIARLRIALSLEVRTRRQHESVPSPLWQSRLRAGRIDVSSEHGDFATLLAEALDTLAECEFDPKPASETLKCSASQLVKFLHKEPQAITLVNRERRQRGGHPLR